MANYDTATQDFISQVAGPEDHLREGLSTAKKTMQAIRNPKNFIQKEIGKQIVKNVLFENEKTGGLSAMQLLGFMNSRYSRDWWDWEPETIEWTLNSEHGIQPTPEIRNLIGALQVVHNTSAAHENWHVFEKVGHAINDNIVDFSAVQPLELDEVAFTKAVLDRIQPKAVYDHEVLGYIAAVGAHSGMAWLPKDLFGDVQELLDTHNKHSDCCRLRDEVSKAYGKPINNSTNLAVKIQLLRLEEVSEYVKTMLK